MSAVVLDNSIANNPNPNSSVLTANGGRFGGNGVVSKGPVSGVGIVGQGNVFVGAITLSDDSPAGASRAGTTYFTTYASDTNVGGLSANQRQSFAYADAAVAGSGTINAGIQQFENGAYYQNTTGTLPTAGTVFLNKPNFAVKPLTDLFGTFTMTGAVQNITVAGITSGSRIRLALIGGSSAAFTSAAATGIVAPVLTITVGATQANGSFAGPIGTAATAPVGSVWAWEVLLG